MQRTETVLVQGQGQEKEVIREQGLNVTKSLDLCTNSACARASDAFRELHTEAVHKTSSTGAGRDKLSEGLKHRGQQQEREKQEVQDQEQ